MLEKYVSGILIPILSKYAENIDAKQLNIDLWNGQAALHNLVLRPSALDDLDLPVLLKRGLCKTIRISIPFRNLQSKPCVVEIEELLLTVDSQLNQPYSAKDVQDRLARRKEAALEQFERERKRRLEDQQQLVSDNANSSNKNADAGYVSRLTEVIMNNLVIHVKAVHIRYENERSQTIVGALLSGVNFFTADESGQSTFVEPSKINKVRKMLEFDGLQVYCAERPSQKANDSTTKRQHSSSSFVFFSQAKTVADWERLMREVISRSSKQDQDTVFGPVRGTAKTSVVFKSCIKSLLSTPYLQSSIHLDNFVASLSRKQYEMLLSLASELSNWQMLAPFYQFRPPTGTPVIGNPKQWWLYAGRSVRFLLRKPRDTVAQTQQSLSLMPDYAELFKEKVLGKESPQGPARIAYLAQRMLVSDMITCRRKVYTELAELITAKRRKQRESAEQQQQSVAAPKKSSGWFSNMFAGKSQTKEDKEAEREELEFRELEKEWGITPGADQAEDLLIVDLPKNYCWSDIAVELPEFGVVTKLLDEAVGADGQQSTSYSEVKLKQMSVRIQTFNAPRCVNFDVAIGDFIVSNPQAESKGLVPLLISRQKCGGVPEEESDGSLLRVRGSSSPLNPSIPDADLDVEAYISILPLCIVADPPLLHKLLNFWEIPSSVDVSSIEHSSRMIATAVQSAASAELSNAIGGSKSYLIKIDAAAPFVVLPRTLLALNEPALVVSLGHFHFESEPLTNSERNRRLAIAANNSGGDADNHPDPSSWSNESSSNMSEHALELHYYANTARVESMFVLLSTLGNAIDTTASEVLASPLMNVPASRKGFEIIPNIVIDLSIFFRIVSSAEHRDVCVVRATCPEMRFAMSLHQSYILSTMVSRWTTSHSSVPLASSGGGGAATNPVPGAMTASDEDADELASTIAQLKSVERQNAFSEGLIFGGDSSDVVSPITSSPTTLISQDRPIVRGSLQIGVFGFEVFTDDQVTKLPSASHRFALHATPANVAVALRSSGLLLEVSLAALKCVDRNASSDREGLILNGSDVCAVIRTPTRQAIAIDIENYSCVNSEHL